MSHTEKRSAETAFEDGVDSNPHSSKRYKKRRLPKKKAAGEIQNSTTLSLVTGGDPGSEKLHTEPEEQDLPNVPTEKQSLPTAKTKDKANLETKTDDNSEETAISDGAVVIQKRVDPTPKKYSTKQEKRKREKERQERKHSSDIPKSAVSKFENPWSMRKSAGGAFVRHDPIFVENDQYLVLPTESEVHVYSTATSLLVRSLDVGEYQSISSCTISHGNPSRLLVATRRGQIFLWDWTNGHVVCQWKTRDTLKQILSLTSSSGVETILALHDHKELCTISSYKLSTLDKSAKEIKTYLKRDGLDSSFQFFRESGILIATAYKRLVVGHCPGFDTTQLQKAAFTWRETVVMSPIVSVNCQIRQEDAKSKSPPLIDVALGLKSGMILVYENLLGRMIASERAGSTGEITARQLHWHRSVVNTVKWSRDGNYLISGGNETVLVIWQLDTNQKQMLPHLSTSILNLTVSEAGSAYAILMGDNSIMVLSTADLLPSANIVGPAIPTRNNSIFPCALNPKSSEQLLMAVPSNIIDHNNPKGRQKTALQTFDLATNTHLNRQALTRNLTTAINTAADGQVINEPNITNLQISYDGKWLATVEQWYPAAQDNSAMYLTDEAGGRSRKIETCLRFWICGEEGTSWEMNTRIDVPHSRTGNVVLDLRSHPTKVEFATIGSDMTVRTWSPKARLRDGVPIKNQSGMQLFTWTSSQSLYCNEIVSDERLGNKQFANLAYSDDGSVLAASWSTYNDAQRYVHLINCQSGKTSLSLPGLASSGPAVLGISGRLLLVLSNNFCVFDMITSEVLFSVELDPIFHDAKSGRYLVVNKHDGTFAIATNTSETSSKRGKLVIIDTEKLDSEPLFQRSIPSGIVALLPNPTTPGYVVIDGSARIRQVRGPGATNSLVSSARVKPDEVSRSLDSIFGSRPALSDQTASQSRLLIEGGAESATRTLEEVIGFQRSADAPPVGDLFDRVASLFASSTIRA